VRALFIVDDLHVAVNNIKCFSVAMEVQQWDSF
jgi:hypothetical protein